MSKTNENLKEIMLIKLYAKEKTGAVLVEVQAVVEIPKKSVAKILKGLAKEIEADKNDWEDMRTEKVLN